MISKINLKPSVEELDAHDLNALLKLYLQDCASRVNRMTLKDYTYCIAFVMQWWAEVGPSHGWLLTKKIFESFIDWMEHQPNRQGDGLSSGTIAMTLHRTSQAFGWACKNQYLDRDYGDWLPSYTPQATLPRTLPKLNELPRLFRAAGEGSNPARDKAILAVLIGTGMRRAECTSLNVEDIEFGDNRAGRITIHQGKGGKPRIVIFDEGTGKYLIAYLVARGSRPGALFRSQRGDRLTPKGLHTTVTNLVKKAKLEDKIHGCHDLRRVFATFWTRQQRGEGFLQPLSLQLGHTDPKMTLHYSKQDISDVEKTFVSPMKYIDVP